MADSWTKEWPAEPGRYWFWGQPYRNMGSPQMYLIKVHGTPDSVAYVVDGAIMYREDGGEGMWCPAILPEPPEEEIQCLM